MHIQLKSCIVSVLIFLLAVGCSKDTTKKDNPDPDTNGEETNPNANSFVLPIAIFNDPVKIKSKINSMEIADKIEELINATPGGETIYMNMYEINYTPVSSALIRAYQRGVTLYLMADSSSADNWKINKTVMEPLRAILSAPSKIVMVNNDVAAGSINHNKYFLFSSISIDNKKIDHVVLSSSMNFTPVQYMVLQDAVVLSDEPLYQAFVDYWNEIEVFAKSGMKNFQFMEFQSVDNKIRAFFYPKRRDGQWDGSYLAMDILDELSDFANDTILVGMSQWSDGQIEIADKLIDLKIKGAHVEVITRYEGGTGLGVGLTNRLKALQDVGGEVLFLPNPYIIHSKYMLFKGKWRGAQHSVVMNGSLNWTNPSTQNQNNLVLMLVDSPLYEAYMENYNDIKAVFVD